MQNVRVRGIQFVGLALALLLPFSAAAQWPGWRGPERNGDTGLLREWPEDGSPFAWKADGSGHGWSNAAVADGTVDITGDQDWFR
jgi:hypothetical protein